MRHSILNEIRKIRCDNNLNINYSNNNPYRILINDIDGGISAYYFSCPIYRENDKKLINLQFTKSNDGYEFIGINSKIHIKHKEIIFSSDKGTMILNFQIPNAFIPVTKTDFFGCERACLESNELFIFPTFNGVLFWKKPNTALTDIVLSFDNELCSITKNSVSTSFMLEEHFPFATISSMFSFSDKNIEPLFYELYSNDNKHRLQIKSYMDSAIFCIDLYSRKSILDTTVESGNPDINNAFGNIAFLGNSEAFGEQWLYSRIDVMQVMDLNNMFLDSANLLAPVYGEASNNIEAFKMTQPWCSFGSTWNTKIEPSERMDTAEVHNGYLSANITEIVRDILRFSEPRNPGIVLRPVIGQKKYTLLSTGDNYFAPQIIEIKLKRS